MMFSNPDPFTFTVKLTTTAHQQAERLCQVQQTLIQAETIYLNTLAVYAVNYYLQCMGVETHLAASHSQDEIWQLFDEGADLEIANVGKLECCPVLPGSLAFDIPVETLSERMGYVAVELNGTLTEAKLLGFTPKAEPIPFPIAQLQPIAELPLYLQQFCPKLRLTQWLGDEVVNGDWQGLEAVFGGSGRFLEPAVRSQDRPQARRVKKLDFGLRLNGETVALVITVDPEIETNVNVLVQVIPLGDREFLPMGLKLTIALESDRAEAIAREADNLIQLEFSESLGSPVTLKVELEGTIFTEEFVV